MSMQPIITGFDIPLEQGSTAHLVGTGFGRVSACALVDTSGRAWEIDFHVDTGFSVHAYIPPLLADGSYIPVLYTLDGTQSTNEAGLIVLPLMSTPVINPSVAYSEPLPDPASPATVAIRSRLRLEIGDNSQPFQTSLQTDGFSTMFSLPVGVLTSIIVGMQTESGARTLLTPTVDYVVESRTGTVTLTRPPPDDATLTFSGTNNQFYLDSELDLFIRSAALKHTHNAETLQRYIDSNGFRQYLYTDATVDTIAPVEHHLIAILAAIEALEVIQSDMMYDIDVSTADGTMLPRSQRFRNVGQVIAAKQIKYDDLCKQLGVGLGRVETFVMRRVSRTLGKLVPIWVEREYDERGLANVPLRVLEPRNKKSTGEGFDQPDPRAYFSNGMF